MLSRSNIVAVFTRATLLLLGAGLLGCGGENVTHVSGRVTFGGQPVPAGQVYILPDGTKGSTGAAGYADIKDGVFDTKLPGGKAAAPGAVIFAVEGIDPVPPPNAAPDVTTTVLFPRYEVSGELTPTANTRDIEVPLTAAQVPRPAAQP